MKRYFWLIVILFIGTLLRFYHNLDISIWHDEAFSALMIRYPWQEMFYRLGLDVHPPMYYIFLRIWHYIFGDSMLALRGFSIFFGVATVWAVWLFVKTAFKNEKAALWAALLVALNPFQIQYVAEARMYTFGAFFALLAGYFLVKALHFHTRLYESEKLNMPNFPESIKTRLTMLLSYAGFTVSIIIIIYTHYYLLFTAAAICFYGVVYLAFHHPLPTLPPGGGGERRGENFLQKFKWLLLSFIVIVLSFLPWLKIFLFQLKQVGGGYWIPQMNVWSIPGTLWTILLSINHDTSNPLTQKALLAVVLFSVFFFSRFLKKTDAWAKWLVLFATLAPFAGAVMFVLLARLKGSKTSVYEERYFLYAGTFYIIALAVWLSELKHNWLAKSLFAVYAAFNLYAFGLHWYGLDVHNKPGMRGAAKYLGANVETNHHLFLATSFEFFNYKYYELNYYPLPVGVQPLLFTGGRGDVSQISHVEGVALLSNNDLAADFTTSVRGGDTVWLLWTYAFGSNKPSPPKNWTQIDERSFADVRPWSGTEIYVTEYKVN